MVPMKRFIFTVFFLMMLSACSLFNPLLYDVAFRDYADESIGKNVAEFTRYKNVLSVITEDDGYEEYWLEYRYANAYLGEKFICHWAVLVPKGSETIESWRYISEPDRCKSDYFYSGPW